MRVSNRSPHLAVAPTTAAAGARSATPCATTAAATAALITAPSSGTLERRTPHEAVRSQIAVRCATVDIPSASNPAEQLAAIVKTSLSGLDAADLRDLVASQFRRLRLLDEQGRWATPELERNASRLLPPDLDASMVHDFVDAMARAAEQNSYLMRFLRRAARADLGPLEHKLADEGSTVLPRAVALAVAINQLTYVEIEDPDVLESVLSAFRAQRAAERTSFKDLGPFMWAKLMTVEDPIRTFIASRASRHVAPDFARCMLPVNVLEAMAVDVWKGHGANAAAALPLVLHPPGGPADPVSGGGPAAVSEDGKVIRLQVPLAREWADLYATWNLAFCAQLDAAPLLMTKLLIPEVNDYASRPDEYLFRRTLALYTYLHFTILGEASDRRTGSTGVQWALGEPLLDLWGATNRQSAAAYEAALAKARG